MRLGTRGSRVSPVLLYQTPQSKLWTYQVSSHNDSPSTPLSPHLTTLTTLTTPTNTHQLTTSINYHLPPSITPTPTCHSFSPDFAGNSITVDGARHLCPAMASMSCLSSVNLHSMNQRGGGGGGGREDEGLKGGRRFPNHKCAGNSLGPTSGESLAQFIEESGSLEILNLRSISFNNFFNFVLFDLFVFSITYFSFTLYLRYWAWRSGSKTNSYRFGK